ncbi:hypothetical protein D9M71_376290 [compost metagenome]
MFAPVAAAGAGIEQGAAQAIGAGAADQRAVGGLQAVVGGVRALLGVHVEAGGEVLGDRPGHEVDDAADVLRPVAHRAAAAHHVHRVHVAHGHRRQRQLRLAVGREGHRDAVHQHGGARGQARVEATDAEVQRQVVAAGAVVQRRADAGDAVQHFAGGGRALRLELLAAHHVARAGVFEDVDGAGIGQPVADHGDRLQVGRLLARRGLQGEGAILARPGFQSGTGEQRGERLGGSVFAIQRLAVAAGGLLGAEGDQYAGLLAQVIERLFQRFGGEAVVLALIAADFGGAQRGIGCQGGAAEAGEKQGAAQGRKGAGEGHLGRCSGVVQVGFPPLSREVRKKAQAVTNFFSPPRADWTCSAPGRDRSRAWPAPTNHLDAKPVGASLLAIRGISRQRCAQGNQLIASKLAPTKTEPYPDRQERAMSTLRKQNAPQMRGAFHGTYRLTGRTPSAAGNR